MKPEEKRRLDRVRARAWLAQHPERLVRVLQLAFGLKEGMSVQMGMRGSLARLSVLDREKKFLARGVAGLIVGEGTVRPLDVPDAQKQGRARRRSDPIPLGPVTLSRPGLKLLERAGHPVVYVPPAGKRPGPVPDLAAEASAP